MCKALGQGGKVDLAGIVRRFIILNIKLLKSIIILYKLDYDTFNRIFHMITGIFGLLQRGKSEVARKKKEVLQK